MPTSAGALADLYRKGAEAYLSSAAQNAPDEQTGRVFESAMYLMEHLQEVPVHVIPCLAGRPPADTPMVALGGMFGSIFPAVWNFQLALRARGWDRR